MRAKHVHGIHSVTSYNRTCNHHRGYSNKKAEYLMYQEEGTAEAFRVLSDVAGER